MENRQIAESTKLSLVLEESFKLYFCNINKLTVYKQWRLCKMTIFSVTFDIILTISYSYSFIYDLLYYFFVNLQKYIKYYLALRNFCWFRSCTYIAACLLIKLHLHAWTFIFLAIYVQLLYLCTMMDAIIWTSAFISSFHQVTNFLNVYTYILV